MSPYNIILGQTVINALDEIISTRYLVLKYMLPSGHVGTIQGNQKSAQECYQRSLAAEREELALVDALFPEALDECIDWWDPKLGVDNEKLMPTKNLNEVSTSPSAHQVICTSLTGEEEHELVNQLIKNVNLFA